MWCKMSEWKTVRYEEGVFAEIRSFEGLHYAHIFLSNGVNTESSKGFKTMEESQEWADRRF